MIRKVADRAPAKCGITIFFMALLLLGAGRAWGISDVCEDQCTALINDGLFACGRNCDVDLSDDALSDPEFESLSRAYEHLPVGLYFLNLKVRTRLKPPVIKNVETSDTSPAAGDVVKVTVSTTPPDEGTPAPEITAFYSYDNAATWHADTASTNLSGDAAAFIPVPSETASIRWFLRARDPEGNDYIEIPCSVAHFPFEPGECLAPLAADSNYSDYENFSVNPEVDIVRSRMGEDDKYYYFEVTAAAPVSEGEYYPMNMNMYVVAVYDTDQISRSEPMEDIRFITYAPLYYTPADCALISRKGANWLADTSSADCRAIGDTIHIRAPKNMINPGRRSTLYVFLATIRIVDDHLNIIKNFDKTSSFLQKSVISDYTGVTAVTPIIREINIARDE